MTTHTITVPDIGSDEAAEVVEVCVAVGDQLELEQSLIVLETDKASVEVPCSHAGKVTAVLIKEGDQLKTGSPILEIELVGESSQETNDKEVSERDSVSEDAGEEEPEAAKKSNEDTPKQSVSNQEIKIPDLSGAGEVDVIEVCVAVGDEIAEGDSLIVLETDKASMEVPSPYAGKIVEISVLEGAKAKEGQVIAVISTGGASDPQEKSNSQEKNVGSGEGQPTEKSTKEKPSTAKSAEVISDVAEAKGSASMPSATAAGNNDVYAGPSVRKLARQLGVDLSKVKSTGPRNRSTKEDVRKYVRDLIANKSQGSGIPAVPAMDFAKFGTVERVKRSKIHRVTATNMHRSWLNVPHVTQFDDADITDLETYRKAQKAEAEKRGVKLSPVPFLLKACAMTLRAEPSFNVSLDPDGEHLFKKNYVHIGMAVDTPAGLVVPVLRDVDKKSVWDIAKEINEFATKAREGKLLPKEMQGGCFTVSSLGAIGGQGFTPIVNTPEVGILGVSKASIKPWWNGKEFEPRTFLPVSLSYDHRAVNGADAGKFLTHLVGLMQAVEQLMSDA